MLGEYRRRVFQPAPAAYFPETRPQNSNKPPALLHKSAPRCTLVVSLLLTGIETGGCCIEFDTDRRVRRIP